MSSATQYVALPQAAGYAVVVGLGAVFAAGMVLTTFCLKRYNKEIMTAEEFATAGRSVKKFLLSAAVVSSWTWAATLLTSTVQVYNNGVSGALYYAAGATVQIVLFACLAIKGKERAPFAHTYLEIVQKRYGSITHGVYCFWGFATKVLVTAMLLTGGSAVVHDLTGMNVVAACLLLPLGVVIYTLFGGIKATFLTDYAHTVVIVVIMLVFGFNVFAVSDKLGSPGAVWDIVTELAETLPREGNAGGYYLTIKSHSGGIFFVINIVGNFGTVFLDNGYFNKAFASDPVATLPGYVMGGLAWFAIPMFVATTMGLTALSLENTPAWPTYPAKMTSAEVSAGLVLPNAAVALLGKSGAVMSLLLVFMAVTSAMSAELIAVSSIFTYDIFRTYIDPKASGKKLIIMSHASVIVFAYVMAGFAIGLYYAGISMGYLYELMGVIIGGAVLPSALTLLSKNQNWTAATFTPPIATGLAIMLWLVCTKSKFGSVTVDTTFEDDSMLTGNVVALLSPLIIVPVLTLAFKPQHFDWNILKSITRVSEEEELLEAESLHSSDPEYLAPVKSQITQAAREIALTEADNYEAESARLNKAFKFALGICVFLAVCLILLWPIPMYGSGYIFSKNFFTGWIVVLFIWSFVTAFIVIIGPLWEGREGCYTTFRGIYWDLTGQGYKVKQWQNSHPEQLHAVRSQVSAQLSEMKIIDGRLVSGDGYTTPVLIDTALEEKNIKD
ncbi:Na+/solute symporter [Metschnikowia bicuspidata var. bicuspidata NRRL YB-4993]|uniref:Na+/solute symporter n=1 Tax=Metschnikowia bicuspidata var. bicuspidata NRRL YB-4993 TaxID=869754 RepID=A0A1A0HK36_9ASCO|nr:Na+/solute symporter [Metschnikowia bicuspidata var. bicuspidata NRRL YB-4993]OBA24385.1 Na+/solute symporter [Metschnikowia bicuspidata var. bicuspidata NRRL YB-4993]